MYEIAKIVYRARFLSPSSTELGNFIKALAALVVPDTDPVCPAHLAFGVFLS